MSNPKLIQEHISGNIHVKEDTQFNNADAERVLIESNVTARIYGNVKDVVLKEGSRLYLHGIISGNVLNEGGEIHLFQS